MFLTLFSNFSRSVVNFLLTRETPKFFACGVEKFMVEKSGVERSGVEAWGWKVKGWDFLQPFQFVQKEVRCTLLYKLLESLNSRNLYTDWAEKSTIPSNRLPCKWRASHWVRKRKFNQSNPSQITFIVSSSRCSWPPYSLDKRCWLKVDC